MQGLLTLFLFVVGSYALSCTQQYQCQDVSTDYNYVSCSAGTCQCNTDFGFVGAATTSDKCACPTGFQVLWQNGVAWCIRTTDSVAYNKEQARNQILLSAVRYVYNSLIWPTPYTLIQQLISGNLHGGVWDLFAPHSNGRVDPVGSFHDEDGVVEYFYGSVWTGTSQINNVNITKLYVQDDTVFVRAILNFSNWDKYPGGNYVGGYLLTQSGTFTFNSDNKIESTELIIHNLGWALGNKFDNTTKVRNQVCQYYFSFGCNTNNNDPGGWTTMDECLAAVNPMKYGSWDQVRDDTVVCRYYHAGLAYARPATHCPHVGPTGGLKCVPMTYISYYDEAY